jgi:predicted secreted Zn-dependent protease
MSPTDAVTLNNFFPTPTDVQLRLGYTKTSTGITGQVNTVMNYAGVSSQKLFAAAGTKIYNADTSTATQVVTGLTSDKFQYVNMANIGGQYLTAVNGTDANLVYNGTNWITTANTSTAQTITSITKSGTTATMTTASAHGLATGNQITVTGAISSEYNGTFIITVTGTTTLTYTMLSTPAANATVVGTYTVALYITGVDSKNLVHVNLFKNRLYYTEKNSMRVWYLPTNAIGGAATALDFGGIARMGGYIQAMGTWTIDAGQGADDYAVFVTNNGEVIVYNGTDPSDPAAWALKGVWQLGQTFNRKCFLKWGGDLLLLTQDGLVPLASALQSSRLDPRINITDKIYYAISQAATLYSSSFGWQIAYFASNNMLLINVPTSTGTQQFVMHTISKAWAQFTGINATCFELHNELLYFGGNGFVGQYWNGYSDDGSNINASVQQAYSYFDAPGQLKRFTLVRPIIQTDNGFPSILCGINVDFDYQNQLGQIAFNPASTDLGTWDNAYWDTNTWGGNLSINRIWQGVTGLGFSAGINMSMASQGIDVHWVSTDYVMERGGVL